MAGLYGYWFPSNPPPFLNPAPAPDSLSSSKTEGFVSWHRFAQPRNEEEVEETGAGLRKG